MSLLRRADCAQPRGIVAGILASLAFIFVSGRTQFSVALSRTTKMIGDSAPA